MNSILSKWLLFVEEKTSQLKKSYTSASMFSRLVDELISHQFSPIDGLYYLLESPAPFLSIEFGNKISVIHDSATWTLNDNRPSSTLAIQYHLKSPLPDSSKAILDVLLSLFKAYWNEEFRTESAGMPDLKRSTEAIEKARRTVEFDPEVVIVCCDLDNFKKVNDEKGHSEGDRIIKEFGSIIESSFSEHGVVLHDGGDEFKVLLREVNISEALLICNAFQIYMQKYDFSVDPICVTTSIGVATCLTSIETFEGLTKSADLALTEIAKKVAGKATTRLPEVTHYPGIMPTIASDCLVRSLCIIKSQLETDSPFASPWANALSALIFKHVDGSLKNIETLGQVISDFINWAKIELSQTLPLATANGVGASHCTIAILSPMDIVLASAHGIHRSMYHTEDNETYLNCKYSDNLNKVELLLNGHTLLWTNNTGVEANNEFNFGRFCSRAQAGDRYPDTTARAVLVQIGHGTCDIQNSVIAERIVVDDRPSKGGGLPDFWEATIARLLSTVARNPNIVVVYLIGNLAHGKQTKKILEEVNDGSADVNRVSDKTALPVTLISASIKKLKGNILTVNNAKELYSSLESYLRKNTKYIPLNITPEISRQQPFLERELRLDGRALRTIDGCRVQTIAEAYPVVLELARKIVQTETIADQAGQNLIELIDFKVHLEKPLQNMIPDFYSNEESSLDGYFEKQFVNKEGLFASSLEADNQLEVVTNHVAESINGQDGRFATRRGILVIPHKIVEGADLSPLGLVSIRIIPRFIDDRTILSYSFTWRTVEALVGFPYSIYGSARYAERLTNIIREKGLGSSRSISMGTVSYVAHSLHVFTDQFGQNIAKRIVDDASL